MPVVLELQFAPVLGFQAFKAIKCFLGKLEKVSNDPTVAADMGEWSWLLTCSRQYFRMKLYKQWDGESIIYICITIHTLPKKLGSTFAR